MSKVIRFCMSGRGLVALLLAAGLGYYLLVEHRDHIIYYLPYGVLLLCPLMHVFMHRGHKHSGGQDRGCHD